MIFDFILPCLLRRGGALNGGREGEYFHDVLVNLSSVFLICNLNLQVLRFQIFRFYVILKWLKPDGFKKFLFLD